jgi:hypothetical protein
MGGHPFLIRLRSRRCWPSDARQAEDSRQEAPLRQPPRLAPKPYTLEQTSVGGFELRSRPQFILGDAHQKNGMIRSGAARAGTRLSRPWRSRCDRDRRIVRSHSRGAGLLEPAGTAAVPAAAGEATVPPPGLVPANRASPVVVPVVLPRGSLTNLIWSNGTATSRSPIPRYPPTPITTAWTLPLLSKISSLMSPILSPLLLL